MKYLNTAFTITSLLIPSLVFSNAAQAVLIGQTIAVDYQYIGNLDVFPPIIENDVTVEAGQGDTVGFNLTEAEGNDSFVNPEAESFEITFAEENDFVLGDFNGFIFDNLTWGELKGEIIGLTFDTNIEGFDESFLDFEGDFISVNFIGLDIKDGSFVNLDLEIQHVPEPLTILGSVTALSFGALFKKKKVSSSKTQ